MLRKLFKHFKIYFETFCLFVFIYLFTFDFEVLYFNIGYILVHEVSDNKRKKLQNPEYLKKVFFLNYGAIFVYSVI